MQNTKGAGELEQSDLLASIASLRWHHSIDLGNGIVTPGREDSYRKLARIGMPEDLSGMTVLDVGAADGFFSFEAERRGARRVVAIDLWPGANGLLAKEAFDLARGVLRSKVEGFQLSVYDISVDQIGSFDLVLFLGVLYHLRHPLFALEKLFEVAKDMLIVETHLDMLWTSRPAAAFYPGSEASKDPTNWWGPNAAAVKAMMKCVGFRNVVLSHRYPLIFRLARAVKYWQNSPADTLQQSRAVFQAWR